MPPFSFGHPNDPREDDPRYDNEVDALQSVLALQIMRRDLGDNLHAVWDDDSGEVVAIVFDQIIYTA